MITVMEPNVHVFCTEGDSDQQASVLKDLFSRRGFVNAHGICSVNSINWFRIAAQSSYYVWAYLQVFNRPGTVGREVNFSVPTGAFGNAMGGFLAKLMGLPVGRIICATNSNDMVTRTLSSGDMSMRTSVAVRMWSV
jgi:threonine synthase